MDNWTRIISLVVANLSKDIDQRLATMESLTALIPPGHPHRPRILEMARDLYAHVNAQRDLFTPEDTESEKPRGSKRLGDRILKR